jgi:predicted MFS family arabinose efflux permease
MRRLAAVRAANIGTMSERSDAASNPQGESRQRVDRRRLLDVFLPFALGYYLSYLFRVINTLIAGDISRDVGLSPAELGMLSSAYFLSFGLFQLPLGLLLDRYGPRRVNAGLLLVTAAGSVAFGLSQGLASLVVARAVIGIGVASCLMGAIKAFVTWFPASRLATLNGWLIAMGGLGALSASLPLEAALRVTDWRGVFMGIAVLTAAVAAFTYKVVPEHRQERVETFPELLAGLRQVFAAPAFWRFALPFALTFGIFQAVQGLWLGPWLRDVAGMDRKAVGDVLFWTALAMIAGLVLFGNLADRLVRQGRGVEGLFVAGVLLSLVPLGCYAAGLVGGVAASFPAMTFFMMTASIAYSIVSRRFPAGMAGRVNTSVNMMVFGAAFALQWGIGVVVAMWEPVAGRYPEQAYQAAFTVCAVLLAASLLPVLLARGRG